MGTHSIPSVVRRLRYYLTRPMLVRHTVPVVLDDSDYCKNPIFVIGTFRSGTSLLRRLLNSHPNIACPPESYFLEHFARMSEDPAFLSGANGLGFDEAEALHSLRVAAGRFHEAFRRANGKPRWADKTPQYVWCAPALARLFGPETRFIVVFRHPFDIAASLYHRKWRPRHYDNDLLANAIALVRDAHRRQQDFMDSHANQTHALFYERLCHDVRKELTAALDFCGEHWNDDILDFATRPHNYGIEDRIVQGSRKIQVHYGSWRELDREQIQMLEAGLGETAERLGYSVSWADAAPHGSQRLHVPEGELAS